MLKLYCNRFVRGRGRRPLRRACRDHYPLAAIRVRDLGSGTSGNRESTRRNQNFLIFEWLKDAVNTLASQVKDTIKGALDRKQGGKVYHFEQRVRVSLSAPSVQHMRGANFSLHPF